MKNLPFRYFHLDCKRFEVAGSGSLCGAVVRAVSLTSNRAGYALHYDNPSGPLGPQIDDCDFVPWGSWIVAIPSATSGVPEKATRNWSHAYQLQKELSVALASLASAQKERDDLHQSLYELQMAILGREMPNPAQEIVLVWSAIRSELSALKAELERVRTEKTQG